MVQILLLLQITRTKGSEAEYLLYGDPKPSMFLGYCHLTLGFQPVLDQYGLVVDEAFGFCSSGRAVGCPLLKV